MDFEFNTDGDLSVESGNIITVSGKSEAVQLAMCMIASVSHDWFYDNIGCDLEQLIGKPCTDATLSSGANIIFDSIVKTKLFTADEIKIESKKIENEYIGYTVYLEDSENFSYYYQIDVEIDLIKGISVRLGDDKVCLY